jgi:hypothetical protein
MSITWMCRAAGCTAALLLSLGTAAATAAGPGAVLKFDDPPGVQTGIGFNLNSNAAPPIGAGIAIAVRIVNAAPQFGKPAGATVGHALLQCTILSEPDPQQGDLDGYCSGIAHVPNGYLTFAGNGIFANASTQIYAITGGVGPYADARGQIVSSRGRDGRSDVTVELES